MSAPRKRLVPFRETKRRSGGVDSRLDFRDRESQRVLSAAANDLARELGRQAAREFYERKVRR